MVCDLPILSDRDLGDVERSPIALRETENNIDIVIFASLADTVHLRRVKRHRVGLILFENGLASNKVVGPRSPWVSYRGTT